eukprot:38267-Prymnesium_polylepis.2
MRGVRASRGVRALAVRLARAWRAGGVRAVCGRCVRGVRAACARRARCVRAACMHAHLLESDGGGLVVEGALPQQQHKLLAEKSETRD